MADQAFNLLHALDSTRDSYGFALRPQHTQRYRQYANIYKEEEEERSKRWKDFLEQTVQSSRSSSSEEDVNSITEPVRGDSPESDLDKDVYILKEAKSKTVRKWGRVRSSLGAIEKLMISRVKKRKKNWRDDPITEEVLGTPIETTRYLESDVDFQTENDVDYMPGDSRSASVSENKEDIGSSKSGRASMEELVIDDSAHEDGDFNYNLDDIGGEKAVIDEEPLLYWKEELECLVQGGIPKDLRGEVWQALVGVKTRREERYYHHLLAQEDDHNEAAARKWKRQIEKDLPRTFPGHPALNEDGRDSLRRVLLAYARHNPSVGYCQAMNFFAGLLLLLMPEENAFWTLVGIMDDYFDGYYTEEMIESQVDQLVFEELMQERFPKLVNHLDYLGVQVAWISGPWFLSIFMNLLPWESVLRVWDVLLYDGNRVMLFRTAMALMELYGPALITTKDAADATTLLQSLVGSTFDSSQLVMTASMGFLAVTEARLDDLRCQHRPSVLEAIEERAKQGRVWKDSKGLATKLYSFKHDPKSLIEEKTVTEEKRDEPHHTESHSTNLNDLLDHLAIVPEVDSLPDLQEQVVWLKVELCRLLEEKRSAILRAEELETALMEMVKQDNRRQLSARVEQLEQEVAYLHQALDDKREQEAAMLKVLMRVEHEQQLTEDARLSAEQEVATQKYALHVLQENYEKAMASISDMEKRVVIAESTLEATLQYQSGKVKALSSPRTLPEQTQEPTKRMVLLPFNLGWRDRNKPKPGNAEQSSESKSANEQTDPTN